jgi:hypothetical protein
MKQFLLVLFYGVFFSIGHGQSNRVFAGGEAINFGIVDISLNNGSSWSSERSEHPGYFSLLEQASFIGFSDQSNIDGYIKKYGNTSFAFPVGNGKKLRMLEMSKPIEKTDAYATAWIEGDPTNTIDPTAPFAGKHSILAVDETISSVSQVGQWDWQVGEAENLGTRTTGNGAGLTIVVSMPDMSQFANPSDLRLVGWNGKAWIDLSGKVTATGNKENDKLSGTMLKNITAIAIGKTSTSALVKLSSITATSYNCNTLLKWETSVENSSSIFILEQSTDNVNFQNIASQKTSGSSTSNYYSKEIVQPFGMTYYRLKIQHANGLSDYSQTISFNNTCNEIEYMKVYPNPVVNNENINLRFTTSYTGPATLMIFKNNGQQMIKKEVQVKPGTNDMRIEIKNLINGSYFINLIGSKGEKIGIGTQFIKQ